MITVITQAVFTYALLSIIAKTLRSVLLTRGEDVIRDLSQDVCERMWVNRATFDASKGNVEAWAVTIAKNVAKDFVKGQREKNLSLNASPEGDEGETAPALDDVRGRFLNPEQACIAKETAMAAQKVAEQAGMGDTFAAVLDGATDDEMAAERGIAPGGVRKRRHDMRKRIAREVER